MSAYKIKLDDGREVEADEPVLPDDYKVYCTYCYVADGQVIRSMIEGTVRQLKADIPAKEIRRCDMDARDLF